MFPYWRYCYLTPAALYRRLEQGPSEDERRAIRSILDARMRRAAIEG